ncbi:hypothetical protein F383_01245 [Gossypium arboreum]|uniref:Uncharacterized protein n=1 Tax=Gossypium arboreum TaxID=29729 RepID=A0A0B0PLR3_GOSAR|nr:hypothetical protein F383_01245 [Gossypium arboreum]
MNVIVVVALKSVMLEPLVAMEEVVVGGDVGIIEERESWERRWVMGRVKWGGMGWC